jgi:hypothetical protein
MISFLHFLVSANMTKLRERMINEMVLRGLAPNTQRAYLQAVTQLARHYGRAPDPRRPPFGPDASLSDDAILGRCARTLL